MTDRDPQSVSNSHVRGYADVNGLRTKRRTDGELILHPGPAKRWMEAWYAGNDEWGIAGRCAHPGPLVARLLAAGAKRGPRSGPGNDGEFEVRVAERDLLRVLDAGGELTRPPRRRRLSPEARAAATARLARAREAARAARRTRETLTQSDAQPRDAIETASESSACSSAADDASEGGRNGDAARSDPPTQGTSAPVPPAATGETTSEPSAPAAPSDDAEGHRLSGVPSHDDDDARREDGSR